MLAGAYNSGLTKVQLKFRFEYPPEEKLLERISDAQSIYGVDRIQLSDDLAGMLVEYDASRLKPREIEASLRSYGFPVVRI